MTQPAIPSDSDMSSAKRQRKAKPAAKPATSTSTSTQAEMVTLSQTDLQAAIQAAVSAALAAADPKAAKAAAKEKAKVDRKAANKARGDEALQRCVRGSGQSEAEVKAVFREAYQAARGLSGQEYKDVYNAVCIERLGVPRYVEKAA